MPPTLWQLIIYLDFYRFRFDLNDERLSFAIYEHVKHFTHAH